MAQDNINPALRSTPSSTAGQGNLSDTASDSLYTSRGGADTLDSAALNRNEGKYKVTQHMYPDDLLGPTGEYGSNYAMFYINVTEDSKLGRDPNGEFVEDIAPRDRGELIAKVERDGNGEAYAASGVVLTGTGASIVTGSGNITKKVIAGAVAYGGAKAVQSQTSNFKAQTKRLKTAIALHMPNNMNIRYGVNYDEKDMFKETLLGTALGGSISLGKSLLDDPGNIMDAAKGAFERSKSGVAAAALSVPGAEVAQKLSGLAPNPKREQLFKSVDFRTFQIDYQFFPRSPQESANVKRIIKQFKYHMHPEYKDTNAFLYIYPSEFDISFYHGTQENLNIHRHTSCVLTEMNVNYTPQGRFNAFADGSPTQINMVLTFRELVPLTKERIEDGL